MQVLAPEKVYSKIARVIGYGGTPTESTEMC